jgi:formate-dependent nitrite reductase membrane component NrfD
MPDSSTLNAAGQMLPVLLLCGGVVAIASVACVIALMIKAAANLALRLGVLAIIASLVLALTTLLGGAGAASKAKTRSLSVSESRAASSSLWLGASALGVLLGTACVLSARRRRR